MRIACILMIIFFAATGVIGCKVSKPYIVEVDRVDQEMPDEKGNYPKDSSYTQATPKKRQLINIDIEFPKIGPTEKSEEIK